jgi:hypothetical protein
LMLFLERVSPLSRHRNPACIKKTKAAQSISQSMSRLDIT